MLLFPGLERCGGVGGDSFQNAECLSGVRRNVINILAVRGNISKPLQGEVADNNVHAGKDSTANSK